MILLILFVAALLRWYDLPKMTIFLGEQGRDLIIANDILSGKLTLLGPPTSISNVHFGPFYHYFNAFFLFLFGRDPIGPAIGFSLLSIVSVYLIYSTASLLGHKKAGLIASSLFAISPWMVEYGRSTFNSFFITSFSAFSLWSLVKFLKTEKKNQYFFLILSGIFAGLAVQANFLAAGVPLGLVLLLLYKKISFKKQIFAWGGLFLAIFPYLAFELRHDFFNFRAFLSLSGEGKAVSFSFLGFLGKIFFNFSEAVYFSLFYSYPRLLTVLAAAAIAFGVFTVFNKNRKSEFLGLNLFLLFSGLIVASLYPGQILVHYLGALYPYIFLLTGIIFEKIILGRLKYLGLFLLASLVILNLGKISFSQKNMPEGWDLEGVRKTSFIIVNDAAGDFNIANLLDGDTRAYTYRYFVQLAGKTPKRVEEYPVSDTLYVIGRDTENILNYPVWEISSFLPAEISKKWAIKNGISLFKLEKL
ncbi:hypothetical protein C4578_03920 [Candidatus Microgenomates bacterium]|jgi:4-amino-4-deoxy-L-arabinose transferase-like glycosyltransferase|nr:MAG: hypothetical protein C4578_03920 [Candidatus Microgenomates bacterium]